MFKEPPSLPNAACGKQVTCQGMHPQEQREFSTIRSAAMQRLHYLAQHEPHAAEARREPVSDTRSESSGCRTAVPSRTDIQLPQDTVTLPPSEEQLKQPPLQWEQPCAHSGLSEHPTVTEVLPPVPGYRCSQTCPAVQTSEPQ